MGFGEAIWVGTSSDWSDLGRPIEASDFVEQRVGDRLTFSFDGFSDVQVTRAKTLLAGASVCAPELEVFVIDTFLPDTVFEWDGWLDAESSTPPSADLLVTNREPGAVVQRSGGTWVER